MRPFFHFKDPDGNLHLVAVKLLKTKVSLKSQKELLSAGFSPVAQFRPRYSSGWNELWKKLQPYHPA